MVSENHAIKKELSTLGGSLSIRGDDIVISEDDFEARASLNSDSVNSLKFSVKSNKEGEDIGFYIELDYDGVKELSEFLSLMARRMKEIDSYTDSNTLLDKIEASRGP